MPPTRSTRSSSTACSRPPGNPPPESHHDAPPTRALARPTARQALHAHVTTGPMGNDPTGAGRPRYRPGPRPTTPILPGPVHLARRMERILLGAPAEPSGRGQDLRRPRPATPRHRRPHARAPPWPVHPQPGRHLDRPKSSRATPQTSHQDRSPPPATAYPSSGRLPPLGRNVRTPDQIRLVRQTH